MGIGYLLPSQLEGLREHYKLPKQGSGQSLSQKQFLIRSEGQKTHLVTGSSVNFM